MSKIFKYIKKQWKMLVTISLLAITIFGTLTYLVLVAFQDNKPVERIIWEWNKLGTFSSDRSLPPTGGFEAFAKVYEYKFVQTKFDIFKPVYTFIGRLNTEGNLPKEQTYIRFRVIYLQRDGLTNWKVSDFKDGDLKQNTLSEATDLTSKHDITTNFPGKENYKITNFQPLTPDEIEKNRVNREQTEARKSQNDLAFETDEAKIREVFETDITPTELLKLVIPYYNSLTSGYDQYLAQQKINEQEYQKDNNVETLKKRIVVNVLGLSFSNKPNSNEREINDLKLKVENYQQVVPKLKACTKLIAKDCELLN